MRPPPPPPPMKSHLGSISGVLVSLVPPPPPPPAKSSVSARFQGWGTPFCPLHPYHPVEANIETGSVLQGNNYRYTQYLI